MDRFNKLWVFVFLCLSGCVTIDGNVPMLDSGFLIACFNSNKTSQSANANLANIDETSKTMLEGSRHFALQLFKSLSMFETKSTSKGIIFSPSSIWSTLLLTYLGSRGETEAELQSKLKLQNLPKESVAMAYKSIRMWKNIKSMNMSTSGMASTMVNDVNKIFVDSALQLNQCFQNAFPEDLETKNFVQHAPEALMQINDWVKNQTNGKIADLLSPGAITSATKLLMINAVYFKSSWAQQFDASKTKKDKFYVSVTEEIEADMMSIDSTSVMYAISEKLQATAIELPYSNPDYSMVIILPDSSKGLDSLIRDLSLASLQDLLDSMYDEEVNLVLPKFKAEQEFELAGPLYSLGIRKLFDPRYVDLSLILDGDQGRGQVALDSVLHRSYIHVNEEGTEAAAATALIFARSGRPAFPTEFVANRPFLYLIRDISTNMILFIGSVRRPSF